MEKTATPAEPLPVTLARVVRKVLLAEQFGTADMTAERVVKDVLAELCPPSHLLITLEAERDSDPGYNTPDGYEPPHDYAILINPQIVHHTITDDTTAGLLVFTAEQAELIPDGLGEIDAQIIEMFATQQSEIIRKADEKRNNPFPGLTFRPVAPAATSTAPVNLTAPNSPDRSPS